MGVTRGMLATDAALMSSHLISPSQSSFHPSQFSGDQIVRRHLDRTGRAATLRAIRDCACDDRALERALREFGKDVISSRRGAGGMAWHDMAGVESDAYCPPYSRVTDPPHSLHPPSGAEIDRIEQEIKARGRAGTFPAAAHLPTNTDAVSWRCVGVGVTTCTDQ